VIPVVTTTNVTNITQTSVTCGGNVTSDGGAKIISRGVCWSLTPNPTLIDAHTSDGEVTGIFTSQVTGLTLGSTYYIRAYASNKTGTAYGQELSFTTASVLVVGLKYAGGIIFYLDSSNQHGFVCAESDQDSAVSWGCPNVAISGADATAIGAGLQNTIDITVGCTTAGSAANICFNLNLNGYNDWFLPSREELLLMYTNLKANAMGGFRNGAYWSSSEMTNIFAWQVIFNNGSTQGTAKSSICNARAVRSF
jgi:hypothetical protein